ncbi:MAG: SOSS complex subunit B family protein [Candidatus Woesearchaeota archaeon]
MNISELQSKQGNVDLIAEVAEVSEAKEFSKFGKAGRVATATIKDETGEIRLSLWNEQIDNVKPGSRIHIKNGFVNEWQGEKQLTTGRAGTIEVLPDAETLVKEAEPEKAENGETGLPVEEPESKEDFGEYSDEDISEEEVKD